MLLVCASQLGHNFLDNGLSPFRRLTVIWPNSGWLGNREHISLNFVSEIVIFVHKNSFQNAFCQLASMLSRLQCMLTFDHVERLKVFWYSSCERVLMVILLSHIYIYMYMYICIYISYIYVCVCMRIYLWYLIWTFRWPGARMQYLHC